MLSTPFNIDTWHHDAQRWCQSITFVLIKVLNSLQHPRSVWFLFFFIKFFIFHQIKFFIHFFPPHNLWICKFTNITKIYSIIETYFHTVFHVLRPHRFSVCRQRHVWGFELRRGPQRAPQTDCRVLKKFHYVPRDSCLDGHFSVSVSPLAVIERPHFCNSRHVH